MSRNRICSIYYRASRADPQQYFSADIARPRRRGDRMSNRRGSITLLGGAAAWPMAARTQQSGSVRRIGVLMNASSDDADGQARVVAFVQALQDLGWTDRRNLCVQFILSQIHQSFRVCDVDLLRFGFGLLACGPRWCEHWVPWTRQSPARVSSARSRA